LSRANDLQPPSATATLQLALPPEWPSARRLRQRVSQLLADRPAFLQQAAAMTASELVENAIKHGDPGSREMIQVALIEQDTLEIRVENNCSDPRAVGDLKGRLAEIAGSDPGELYFARLEELMADPSDSGKLGLLRIAFEGKFTLSCTNTAQSVCVVASRRLGALHPAQDHD